MNKLLLRDIKGSIGRFIAIAMIIMLGVLIFVGVKATGPALNNSLQSEVVKRRLGDVQVLSDKGFTQLDLNAVKQIKGATVEGSKFKYVIGGKNRDAIALYGLKSKAKLDQLIIKNGRLPQKDNEIVLDENAKTSGEYHLGEQFSFAKSAQLKETQYKIVGFVDSPLYIDDTTRGSTNIGSGKVEYFAYIPDQAMKMPVDTRISVRFAGLQGLKTFTNQYSKNVHQKVKRLKSKLNARKDTRSNELAGEALIKIDAAQKKLAQGKQELNDAKNQIKKASDGKVKTNAKLQEQAQQIEQKQDQLDDQRIKLKGATTPTYTWQTRDDLAGFTGYGESSDRIAAIANVFPVFFFLLAALITFTTVTRMVEEARGQIGTLKALGFSKHAIAYEYMMYAFLAGMLGTVLGAGIGNQFIPRFVVSMYQHYVIGAPVIKYDWTSIGIAVILAMFATVGAAGLVIFQEMRTVPAELLRPRSPKKAKKILLERVTWLWGRLKFNQKISYRNLFRFKSRGLMTILGIAGGTALILTGFGIANSIAASGEIQFSQIFKYDAIVQSKTTKQLSATKTKLAKDHDYQDSTALHTTMLSAAKNGKKIDDITTYVPQNARNFTKFIKLRDYKTHQSLSLKNNGVLISEKTATILDVKKGDRISIKRINHPQVTVKVTGITENYVGNFMYTSTSTYKNELKQTPTIKTLLVKLNDDSKSKERHLGKRWIKNDPNILGVSFKTDQAQIVASMTKQLGPVVWIFILLSGLLSFVVLYNLNNINISERLRELSTVKVLGYFDPEVTMYVARESIILALVGILCGYGLGNFLTDYVIKQAETNAVTFPLTIHPSGYITATGLMIIFNLVVVQITHQRLKKVDMVEALKSNE